MWRSLVSRLVRVQEASGSNPDTPTIKEEGLLMQSLFFYGRAKGFSIAAPLPGVDMEKSTGRITCTPSPYRLIRTFVRCG